MPRLDKIATVQPRAIRRMDHNRAIPEICRALGISGQEQIGILGLEGLIWGDENRTVFPAQVAHLACLWLVGVAVGFITALIGVEVGASCAAVSFVGDGILVDVECCGMVC